MAVALIVVGVLMGASAGIPGATVVTFTLLIRPVLLRRHCEGGLIAIRIGALLLLFNVPGIATSLPEAIG